MKSYTLRPDTFTLNFNLIFYPFRYSWLGWGWKGCSQQYYFPPEFNVDYGEPASGAAGLCKETATGSDIFTREFSKSTVTMDCKLWKGSVKMK